MMPTAFKFFLLIRFIFGIGNFDPTLVILRAQEVLTKQTNQTIVATAWVILFYTIFNVIRLISEVSIGFLSDFVTIQKKNLLATLGFGSFALVALLLLIKTQSLWVWSIIFILSGLSLGAVTVLEKAYAAELLPHDAVSEGYGILHMIIGVTSLLASLIVGGLWNYFSAPWGFGYSAFVSIATIILFYILKPS
jgi:MFS family permease